MKQKYNKLPFFHYGEVLTSESLNNAFGYSDEQLRLTRRYTIGYGIIEGLSYTFSNGKLTLEPGVAITPDGHLVKIENRITYKGVIPNATQGYDYDLCPEKTANMTNFPKNMEDYVIVLSATERNTSLLLCSEVSCDAKNTAKELVIDMHLKKKSDTSTCTCMIAPCPPITNYTMIIRLQRMEGCILNINILEKRQKTLFTNNLARVHAGLITLCQIINPGFQSNNKALIPLRCWNLLFTNAKHLAKGLFAFTHSYGNNWHATMKSYPIYYFQHLEILADAINECIAYYNQFAIDHPLLPTPQVLNDSEVFLGLGFFTNKNIDINQRYRSIFFRTNDDELIRQAHILERLLKRVVLLCDHFIEGNMWHGSMELCWYDSTKPLGERPIPYFYRGAAYLYEYWPSADRKPNPHGFIDITDEPSNKSNERLFLHNLYRSNVNDVKEELIEYIEEHHLDITVEVVKLVKKTLRGYKFKKHPNKNYQKILDDTVSNASFRQQRAGKAMNHPVVLCFNQLPGSWKSYVSAAADNKELSISTVKKIVNAFREINLSAYVNYLNIIPVDGKQTTWIITSKNNKDTKVAAFMALKSYFQMSYGLDYDTADNLVYIKKKSIFASE